MTRQRSRPVYASKGEVFTGLGVLLFLCGIGLSFYFHHNRPEQAVPEVGRTHELHDHGSTVFVTDFEANLMYSVILGGWLIGIGGGIAEVINRLNAKSAIRQLRGRS